MKDISTIKDYINWFKKDALIIEYFNYGLNKRYMFKSRGIYFLMYKNVVVYVGISKYSIEHRIFEHLKNKIFDLVKYITISEDDFNQILLGEEVFINIFNPFYNIQNKKYEYKNALNIHQKIEKNKIHFQLKQIHERQNTRGFKSRV